MQRSAWIGKAQLVRSSVATAALFLLAVLVAPVAPAQPDRDSPRFQAALLLEDFLTGDDDTATFIQQHCADNLADGDNREATHNLLDTLRRDLRGGELEGLFPIGPLAVKMEWVTPDGPGWEINFALTDDKPYRFQSIEAQPLETTVSNNPVDLTWETLEEWMAAEAENGFNGAIIVVRDDETALHQGYGWADPQNKIHNTANTIFAIGSTPIDFTKAAIFQLAEQGKLDLDDPITRYFDNVPADKRAITLDHLLSGRSGLQNFHDIPGDENPDHTWIDRDEAIRRIFAEELLFAPGQGRAHSHSAFGVLAAIVEIVSGQSFQDYTRQHLYEPAGMTSTGFFGEPIAPERLAIGHGMSTSGEINAPPYWGPTSWLVMGSGGQTSTVGDMARWLNALHAGKIVNQQYLERIVGRRGGAIGVGGDMFGFEIHYSMAADNFIIVISNDIDNRQKRQAMQAMMRQLLSLLPPQGNPYSVGIGIDADENGLVLSQVVPGSAAERDGLQPGDRLLAVAGKSMRDHDPIDILDALLQTNTPILFQIERNGHPHSITVTPTPRQ